MERINWQFILSHPSEFVRIDEQLRLHLFQLSDYKDQFLTDSILSQIRSHEKIIIAFRDAINIFGRHIFGSEIISIEEAASSWRELQDEEYEQDATNFFQEYTSMTSEMFRKLIGCIINKRNTEKMFQKFLIILFDNFFNVNVENNSIPFFSISDSEKEAIMYNIIKDVRS